MEQQENNIIDAIDGVGVEISDAFYQGIKVGLDTETFNMLAFTLGEIAENTKKIASALQRMEEA